MDYLKLKLELEKIYGEYCFGDLECIKDEDEDFAEMMFGLVKYRLKVSGGSGSNCGASMLNVGNFLNEIFLYENMMDDWNGCYRGDLCYEGFEVLERLVNESELPEDIKKEILEGYREEYGMDEE